MLVAWNGEHGELLEKQGEAESTVLSSDWERSLNCPPPCGAVPLLLLVFALLLSPSNLNGFDEPTPLEETMTGSHAPCAIRGKSQVIGRMTPLVLYLMLKRLLFVGAGVHLCPLFLNRTGTSSTRMLPCLPRL